jgi:VWFA-related protein
MRLTTALTTLAALLASFVSVAPTAFCQNADEPLPRKDAWVKSAVSVTGIDLDTSATSKNGTPVEDLRPDEVVLKIDGRPVPLDYFTPVQTGRLTGTARPGAGADASGLVARQFFLVIDEDHLLPSDRPGVFDAARTLLAQLEPPDRLAAAVLERRVLRPLVDFGTPIEAARKAFEKQEKQLSLGALSHKTSEPSEARRYERDSFRILERAIRSFGSYPGRKEMVVISRGVNEYEKIPELSLRREVDAVVSQANRSRVTVHTIGAGGLTSPLDDDNALC